MTSTAVTEGPPVWARWLAAARPGTLTAAISPVLVGTAAACTDHSFRPLVFAATMFAALLIQIGTNLANDVFDHERGADTAERLGPVRVTQSGLLPMGQVRAAAYLTFASAALIGLYLVYAGGWPILAIGVASIAAGFAYTGGPWPLGYHGLGDVFVFVFFGLVAVTGSYYLQAGDLQPLAVIVAVPVGMTVTAILTVNNLRDIETDRRAGKRTLAVRLGDRVTRWQYAALVLGPYAVLPGIVAAGASAWAALAFLTLPLAWSTCRSVLAGCSGRALNGVLKRTSQLHLAFGISLALGLLL